jgi:hypothetical protein
MPKAAICALIVIGFLFFLIGIAFSKFFLLLGLVLMVAGLWIGLGPDGILRNEQVIDSWSILIENAQGNAWEIFQTTDMNITESNAPDLKMERKSIAPGIVRGIMGAARDFFVVTDGRSMRMKPYKIFLNARDYGNNLDVSWYLTYKPTLLQAIMSLIPFVNIFPKTSMDIDLFDQQDLRAYATLVHRSVLRSVEKVMFALNQDPSKINRKSRGFLGIS